jgi:hypothetical protein
MTWTCSADPEPETAAAQHVETRRLLRDQRGLALRQDQDAGRKAELRRHPGEVREQRERVVVKPRRHPLPAGRARGIGAEHMVRGLDKIETRGFGGLRIFLHGGGRPADIAQRQERAQFHLVSPKNRFRRIYTT